jgi:hypothetical protein
VSHHLDSPLARQDPRLDISDVYLFRGATGTVFVMNVNPLSGDGGFHPEGRYEFKVDTDADAVEDITFRVAFGDADETGRQDWTLHRLDGAEAADDGATGRVLMSGVTGAAAVDADGTRVFAGPAADPFYIEGTVVTAVCKAVAGGTPVDLSGFAAEHAANIFAGTNVGTIVLEVPDDALGVAEIGFWGRTVLATDAGGWRPINRCAQPLVNTIFHPDDSELASEYNTTPPSRDREVYGPRVVELVTSVVSAMGSAPEPRAYAERVRDTLFPDVLRYRVGTAAVFGFAERNGRSLTECVPEVMFALVLNAAVPLGLDRTAATGKLRADFPYLALPLQAS